MLSCESHRSILHPFSDDDSMGDLRSVTTVHLRFYGWWSGVGFHGSLIRSRGDSFSDYHLESEVGWSH